MITNDKRKIRDVLRLLGAIIFLGLISQQLAIEFGDRFEMM